MLQVRDVAVEAGGLPLVSGVSFTLHSGDKVGLVGRNGVGKTTLLQVLAGEAEPSAGVILRRGDLGYLRQDPKLRRADPGVLAVAHILEGRGIAAAGERLEKLRVEVERDPSQRNVARYSRAEEQYRHDGGYAAEGEARRIAAGRMVAYSRASEIRSSAGIPVSAATRSGGPGCCCPTSSRSPRWRWCSRSSSAATSAS